MKIQGTSIHDSSVRFRMYAVVLAGIAAFGALLQWRAQTLMNLDYQEVHTIKRSRKAGGTPSANSARAQEMEKAIQPEEKAVKSLK